jgi:hypothetical protein
MSLNCTRISFLFVLFNLSKFWIIHEHIPLDNIEPHKWHKCFCIYAFDEWILCVDIFFDGILSNDDDERFSFDMLYFDISSFLSSINKILIADFNRFKLFDFLWDDREELLIIDGCFLLDFIEHG